MATYTLLISLPDDEAPITASDLADEVHRALEEHLRFSVATVDALRGDQLHPRPACAALRLTHQEVAGETYTRA